MNNLSTKELYKYFIDTLSYPVLIFGESYSKQRNKILAILFVPLLFIAIVGFYVDYSATKASEKDLIINFLILVVLIVVYILILYFYFDRLDKTQEKWFSNRDNPNELSFREYIFQLRKEKLQLFLKSKGAVNHRQIQDLIVLLEDHQQNARNKVLSLIGLIGGAIVMINDDIRQILVGNIPDKTMASVMYITYAAMTVFFIYKSIFTFKDLNFGKWPIYKQMVDAIKKIS